MKYERHYGKEESADADAMRDIVDYLEPRQWNLIIGAAQQPDQYSCKSLDFMLNFMGVQGFPCFAFIRTMRPDEYDAWYASLPE